MPVSLVLQSLFRFKKLVERKKKVIASDRNIHQKNIDAGELWGWMDWKMVVRSPHASSSHKGA